MTIATIAPPTTCPRCGATLRPEQARWRDAPLGYLPALRWTHKRPGDGRPCHMDSGPPIGYSPPGMPPAGAGVKIPA
jgi:hypothetical protein